MSTNLQKKTVARDKKVTLAVMTHLTHANTWNAGIITMKMIKYGFKIPKEKEINVHCKTQNCLIISIEVLLNN